jgi:preprotein translocase subunit YajC
MDKFVTQLPLLLGAPEATSATGAGGGGGQLVSLLVTFGLIIVIFYFLIIRPQSRKQKETQKMLSNLRKGDKVTTVGGIRGTIHSVKEDSVLLKVDDNTKLEFSRSAISGVISRAEGDEEGAPAKEKQGKRGKIADKGAGNGGKDEEPAGDAAKADGNGSDKGATQQ